MPIYAGIGSRETPAEIIAQMIQVGAQLAAFGWLLRSGHADGADEAFERGCDIVLGKKQIFLPWRAFNGSDSPLYTPTLEAFALAEKIHPAWSNCSIAAKKLHARNCQQVLGQKLDQPADAVVCWTEDGFPIGGTATAITLALQRGIPIFNFGRPPFGAPATADAAVTMLRALA